MSAVKAWAFYDAVHAHPGGCQDCGDDDAFSPNVEAFEETDRIICGPCWEAVCEADVARMHAEEAEDRRRDNPLEPDFRRLGQ